MMVTTLSGDHSVVYTDVKLQHCIPATYNVINYFTSKNATNCTPHTNIKECDQMNFNFRSLFFTAKFKIQTFQF